MAGKVYVAFTQWWSDNESDFHGVFSTAKKAKAAFPQVNYWEYSKENGRTTWLAEGDSCDYVVYKTKIDEVLGEPNA